MTGWAPATVANGQGPRRELLDDLTHPAPSGGLGAPEARHAHWSEHPHAVTLTPVEDDMADQLSGAQRSAVDGLRHYAGCTEARATELVTAVEQVAADIALGVIAGRVEPVTNVTEQRLGTLRRVSSVAGVGHLNISEISGVFRITTGQARSLNNTFRARFPEAVEDALNERLAGVKPSPTGSGTTAAWQLDFVDREVFEHAQALLARRGVHAGVDTDETQGNLRLIVDQTLTDANSSNVAALDVLGIPVP